MTREEIQNKYRYDESIWVLNKQTQKRRPPKTIFTLEQFWLIQELFLLENMKCNKIAKLFNIKNDTLRTRIKQQFNFNLISNCARELQIIFQVDKIHSGNYTYEKFVYDGHNSNKHIFTCKIHGHISTSPATLLSGSGCNRCGYAKSSLKLRKSKIQFIKDSIQIHGKKYDYSKVEYNGNKIPVVIVCKQHNEFCQTPNDHLTGCGCPKCADNQVVSKQHLNVLEFLKNRTQVVEEYRICINPKTNFPLPFDFYLPECNAIIEVHGIQHYKKSSLWHKTEEDFKYQQWKDAYKKKWALENGYEFIEIPYNEEEESWRNRLNHAIKNRLRNISR